MSETETATQGGAEAEPVATTADPNAPGTEGAATETTETTETPEQVAEKARQSRTDRSFARLSAQITAARQETARLYAENETLRRNGGTPPAPQPIPQTAEELERLIDSRAEAKAAQQAVQARVAAFHETGRAAFPDWTERCQSLMQMGADPAFAELLVETPDGAKVAAALADDPEAMERIAGLRTERARAIELGKFVATLENKPPPVQRTSAAPAPIQPIAARGVRTAFNEYRETDASALAEHYAKQAMEKRRQINGR
jgi:hypothetical protein